MTKLPNQLTADFLKALSDQTRFDILELLKNDAKTSETIQKALNKSQSTISQHLSTLIKEQIISFEKKGNKKYYQINSLKIFKILSLINNFIVTREKDKIKSLAEYDIFDTLI